MFIFYIQCGIHFVLFFKEYMFRREVDLSFFLYLSDFGSKIIYSYIFELQDIHFFSLGEV